MKKNIMLFIMLIGILAVTGCTLVTTDVTLGTSYGAPNSDRAFGVANVVINGDIIEKVTIDEFMFTKDDGVECVPSSDGAFGNWVAEGCLISKRSNDTYYSAMMTDYGGATMTLEEGYAAIEAYAIGKTIAELEANVDAHTSEEIIDTVSGSTLVGTKGYLELIISAAKNAE